MIKHNHRQPIVQQTHFPRISDASAGAHDDDQFSSCAHVRSTTLASAQCGRTGAAATIPPRLHRFVFGQTIRAFERRKLVQRCLTM